MRRPIVLVPACSQNKGSHPSYAAQNKYVDAVAVGARCQPLLIPPLGDNTDIESLLGIANGIMLTGAASNVQASLYGQETLDPSLPLDPPRDATTLPLIRAALTHGIPILAICRGFQEVNVALGGTLHQAVHTVPGYFDHREDKAQSLEQQYAAAHRVKLEKGGLLAHILDGASEIQVNSLHGQGIDKLAPATIRAKVGALARCTDWGMRKGHILLPDHPLRTLPDGYAQYTKTDAAIAGEARVDVERDRRLEPGEFEKVSAVIVGGVLPRKQRPLALDDPKALWCMFVLAVESAMRMREMFTLTLDQVDLAKRTAFLDKTKNGDKRQVPLSSVAVATLTAYLDLRVAAGAKGRDVLFPWWDGDTKPKILDKTSDYLSKLYIGIFEAAKCADLKFHDLRHEATSRLFEKTTLSETQIMKITGHKSHRMMMRYANLRGSDLAARLW